MEMTGVSSIAEEFAENELNYQISKFWEIAQQKVEFKQPLPSLSLMPPIRRA
jgi:hypothetical protein